MVSRKRFSKDPKVNLISIEEFYNKHDYLCNISNEDLWKTTTHPKIDDELYKFTSQYMIYTKYIYKKTNYGKNITENLEYIDVAIRDGNAEYKLFNNKLMQLKEEMVNDKTNKYLTEKIFKMEQAIKLLPQYIKKEEHNVKEYESYLIDTGYRTTIDTLKDKYLVFDVETNGVRQANDDLLSITIYDPTSGICYNRYLPLDLQPLVLTGFINGIDEETLINESHITQEEYDWLKEYFQFNDKILLSYSGGKGDFDSTFVQNYFKRQKVNGFSNLKFENIKNKIPSAPYGSEGLLSKDNMCRMFGINGVNDIHSSYNDCLLEWKLFEKLELENVFFIEEHLFKYTPEYIIPYSYLNKHNELIKYSGVVIPNIEGKVTELYNLKFPKECLDTIKKFSTNITGITIEHAINRYLKAEEQDNLEFLAKNKTHLKYIGSLDRNIKSIQIIAEEDGTVKSVNKEDEAFIDEVNTVTNNIINHIKPLADYLRSNIFKEEKIMTQELCISNDGKVLGLCDLSDSRNVVEIKTYNVLSSKEYLEKRVTNQLYYQSKGRNTFVISIVFDMDRDREPCEPLVDDLNIYLYKVDLYETPPMNKECKSVLSEIEVEVLKNIIKNQYISMEELRVKLNLEAIKIVFSLYRLELFGYIKKKVLSNNKFMWVVLRDENN